MTIVAEMCGNWRTLSEAKEMIRVAHEINPEGLVKFQLYDAEDDKGTWKYHFSKTHELSFDQAKFLFDYGASIGQEVFFSVFGVKFVEWCERIGVKRYKIANHFRDVETIRAIICTDKQIILSSDSEWDNSFGDVLFCPDGYPQKDFKIYNINKFDGFSDHSIGLDVAKIAISHDASIIEKHFILEHYDTPDNDWSMTPDDLKELVRWEKVCKEVL